MTLYRWDATSRTFTSCPIQQHIPSGEKVTLKGINVSKGERVTSDAGPGDTLICLLRGTLKVRVAEGDLIVRNNEAIMIPFGFRHSAEAIEDSFALEMVRETGHTNEDYLWGV